MHEPSQLKSGKPRLLPIALLCIGVYGGARAAAAEEVLRKTAAPLLRQFCFDCHGEEQAESKVDLERLASDPNMATNFKTWRQVIEVLQQGKMPPEDVPQPNDHERRQLVAAVRKQLSETAEQYAGDPGPVLLRRLTSAEYAYSIRDLIGLELDLERDFVGDAVGGEGFANVGAVQFMQESTLERYLGAAKQAAAHAVIGAGPLDFYADPGQTGFELSAITRIQDIYRNHGFRTAAGEGGEAYGLDLYPRAFYTAWQFRYRSELEMREATLAGLAAREEIDARFAEYIWSVLTRRGVTFPISEIVEQWDQLPAPSTDVQAGEMARSVRAQCGRIHELVHDWQTRFGQNADAKEEAPVLAVDSFDVQRSKQFEMNINWPPGTRTAHLRLKVESANRDGQPNAVIIWRQPSIQFRVPDRRLEDPRPLSSLVSAGDASRLGFGKHPGGRTIQPHDFVTIGTRPPAFELPILDEATSARLIVTAELDVLHGEDCIVRCTIAQEEETDQGKQVSALLANPQSVVFDEWKAGVLEFARLLPQVSHREPAPSDRDPIPEPFDNAYNNPERNEFHYKLKYDRDDKFLVDNILDDDARERLDQAWTDLLGSFEYHEAYLRFVAKKFDLDLGDRSIAHLDGDWIDLLAEEPRAYVHELKRGYRLVRDAFQAAEARHLEDVVQFASRAWRRPLVSEDRERLTSYYNSLRDNEQLDHRGAIRTLLTRVLIAPEFLYRSERPHDGRTFDSAAGAAVGSETQSTPTVGSETSETQPTPTVGSETSETQPTLAVALTDWELASRLSYALWSSLPDEELRRAAAAGELRDAEQLARQARRMLRDPKARRLAAEFFGQWFGFYQFDRYRGIDTQRMPEFTHSLKGTMYDEAVTFFEYILRHDRPVSEILFADYAFLNDTLSAHYGVQIENGSADLVLVEDVDRHHRGGLLGLGAVLTVTSAPLRTSPVKRGDWLLRRVLGTPVPPPPADAGSIVADDVTDDGLTIRTRLEVHRRDASCNNCHSRIDPLGFALEQYDAIGRWRERYRDGRAIDVSGKLGDGSVIAGIDGLREYLRVHEPLFRRTLCTKLVGYVFGRRESISDVLLIEQMMSKIERGGGFSELVETVVTSRQFRYRRTGGDTVPEIKEHHE